MGHELGFDALIMEHGHNMNTEVDGFVAKNWEDVYNHIIDNEVKSTTYER